MRWRRRRGRRGESYFSYQQLFKLLQDAPHVSAAMQYAKNRDSKLLGAIENKIIANRKTSNVGVSVG